VVGWDDGMNTCDYVTIGGIARQHGLPGWKVRRLWERGQLPPAQRIGAYRVVPISELPRVEAALRAAGYLQQEGVACG
jgi:hypothetical protein